MKKGNIFWGVLFIFAAVFMIASRMGFFGGISFFTVFFTIVFAAIFVKSLYHVEFFGILFSLAILATLYDKQLGIENLTPWPLLGAALFGSIGLSMIFGSHKHYGAHVYHNTSNDNDPLQRETDKEFDTIIDEPDSSVVNCDVNFGSAVKYVNSDCFERAKVSCKFGAAKVYFDHVVLKDNQAEIDLEVSFGGVELFLPNTWKVENCLNASFGGVEEKGKTVVAADAPVIRLYGNVSFAGLTIRYI